jgi:predicted alpha/beta-fold hydrolase
MEQLFTVTTSGDAEIYGVLHQSPHRDLPLVFLVHGLTGHMDESFHLRLGRLLNGKGYPVIRFNQYGDKGRSRKFHTSTIREHVSDTQRVIAYATKKGFPR